MRMNLSTDQHGNINFNDVLLAFFKRSYSKVYNKNITAKASEIIKKAEEISQRKLTFISKKLYYRDAKKAGIELNETN